MCAHTMGILYLISLRAVKAHSLVCRTEDVELHDAGTLLKYPDLSHAKMARRAGLEGIAFVDHHESAHLSRDQSHTTPTIDSEHP
jgi:hypothetical protein